jgi:hypothetical protein
MRTGKFTRIGAGTKCIQSYNVDVRYELGEAMKGKLPASILFLVVSLLLFSNVYKLQK